jgi:hypothetical protein
VALAGSAVVLGMTFLASAWDHRNDRLLTLIREP